MHDETTDAVTPPTGPESASNPQITLKPKRKRRRRLPNFLRPGEIEQLLATARAAADGAKTATKKRAARRDLVMCKVGLWAGLRVSEITNLKVDDLDFAGGVLMVLEGKGGRDRAIPLGVKLAESLREWVGDRRTGWVFHSSGTKRVSPRTFQDRLAALGRRAALTKRLKPHSLRHSFATSLMDAGASLREIQELLGHSNLGTTEVYTWTKPERLRAAVDRL